MLNIRYFIFVNKDMKIKKINKIRDFLMLNKQEMIWLRNIVF